jgi:predicted aspartyl protease
MSATCTKLAAASLWGEGLPELIGHVDPRNRPIISLSVSDQEDAFLAIVDTGFNGELLISETEVRRFKCEFLHLEAPVEFANRERHMVSLARSRIIWFGRVQEVRVWITAAEAGRGAVLDEPVALLGTALLNPYRLTVDFTKRRVVITEAPK